MTFRIPLLPEASSETALRNFAVIDPLKVQVYDSDARQAPELDCKSVPRHHLADHGIGGQEVGNLTIDFQTRGAGQQARIG